MKFSIIIPCYNCAKTITETLNSVITQDEDAEIILINDGSSDDTQSVIEKYIKEHDFDIKAVVIENSGVSFARNTGIDMATGDYIVFIDSDDIMSPGYLNEVDKILSETNADSVYCKKKFGIEDIKQIDRNIKPEQVACNKMITDLMCYKNIFSFCCFTYKRDILNDNSLRYEKNAKYGEDWEFATKYLAHCKNGVFIDSVGFNCRILATSASRTIVYAQSDVIGAATRTAAYLESIGHPFAKAYRLYQCPKAVFSAMHRFAAHGRADLFKRLRTEYDVKNSMKKLIYNKYSDWKTRAMAVLYIINTKLFYFACRILH